MAMAVSESGGVWGGVGFLVYLVYLVYLVRFVTVKQLARFTGFYVLCCLSRRWFEARSPAVFARNAVTKQSDRINAVHG